MQNGQKTESIKTLQKIIKSNPEYLTASSFLADIYLRDGNKNMALQVYQNALKVEGVSAQDKAGIQQAIAGLQQSM
jgi:Tfp pilus assembly protein PilF